MQQQVKERWNILSPNAHATNIDFAQAKTVGSRHRKMISLGFPWFASSCKLEMKLVQSSFLGSEYIEALGGKLDCKPRASTHPKLVRKTTVDHRTCRSSYSNGC